MGTGKDETTHLNFISQKLTYTWDSSSTLQFTYMFDYNAVAHTLIQYKQ